MTIPYIQTNNQGIPIIPTLTGGVRSIRQIGIRQLYVAEIPPSRVWVYEAPQALPIDVPVTTIIGTPIVDMPGCVKVNKENAKNPPNKNNQLVNDDPKQNVVLCDGGMPYYEAPDYDARELTWQTVYQPEDEVDEGVDVEEPDLSMDTPEPPDTSQPEGPVECPPPNARRIGDLNQAGTEKVTGHKLSVDGKICITQWEEVPTVEQFLPSIPIITTTATIATVATASALFAKPLADLLLKVIKPVVKKAIGKVQQLLGKKEERRPNLQERMTEKYREKKGLPPLKKKTSKKGR
tara:strand:+ start:1523 stop:2401 length:879 start_codon:yes stop_codon:yes gene_type:complete